MPAPGVPGRTLHDFAFAIPNGLMLAGSDVQRAKYMAALKRQGFKPGVSDICLALPLHGRPGAYIELKRDRSSRATAAQQDWVDLMKLVGYYAAIAVGFEEAQACIIGYLRGDSPP